MLERSSLTRHVSEKNSAFDFDIESLMPKWENYSAWEKTKRILYVAFAWPTLLAQKHGLYLAEKKCIKLTKK